MNCWHLVLIGAAVLPSAQAASLIEQRNTLGQHPLSVLSEPGYNRHSSDLRNKTLKNFCY
ncbi:hypothetical protein AAVH_39944, partial [Aphelenchoides avenae]